MYINFIYLSLPCNCLTQYHSEREATKSGTYSLAHLKKIIFNAAPSTDCIWAEMIATLYQIVSMDSADLRLKNNEFISVCRPKDRKSVV